MDFYVLMWLLGLILFLFCPARPSGLLGFAAAYRIADIIHYRMHFLFVKGWAEPWRLSKLRRSITFALINIAQLVVAFAIMYKAFAHVGIVGQSILLTPPLTSIQALYFSLVTLATVGFGDLVPLDETSQLLVMTEIISGLLILLLFLPVVLAGLSTRLHDPTDLPTK